MAYGKFKMGRGDGRKTIQPVKPKDEMEGPRKGGGMKDRGDRVTIMPVKPGRPSKPRPNDSRRARPLTPVGDGRVTPGNIVRKRPLTPVGGGRSRVARPTPAIVRNVRKKQVIGRGVPGRKTGAPVRPRGIGR